MSLSAENVLKFSCLYAELQLASSYKIPVLSSVYQYHYIILFGITLFEFKFKFIRHGLTILNMEFI
jgi:hypothetical protein